MEIKIEINEDNFIKSRLNLDGLSDDEIDEIIDVYISNIQQLVGKYQFEIVDSITTNRISNDINTYTDYFSKQVVRDSKIDNILKDGI
jgi:hypothetical protein